ncbi:hypothetical protein [Longibaculum muris]|uniref:hypothetical protein n=3 Tax=Longibaculum muris TaxID=1796628 RepID=UPI0018A0797A|nr:hypothetical protein [Longibaculum muris]
MNKQSNSLYTSCFSGTLIEYFGDKNIQEKSLYLSEKILKIDNDKKTGAIISPIMDIMKDGLSSLGYCIVEINKENLEHDLPIIVHSPLSYLNYHDFFEVSNKIKKKYHYILVKQRNKELYLKDSFIPLIQPIKIESKLENLELIYKDDVYVYKIFKCKKGKKNITTKEIANTIPNSLENCNKKFDLFIKSIKENTDKNIFAEMNSTFFSGGYLACRVNLINILMDESSRENKRILEDFVFEFQRLILDIRLLFVRMYLSNSNIYVNEIINKIIKLKEVLSIIKNTMFKKFHTNLKLNKNRLTFLHPFSYAEN